MKVLIGAYVCEPGAGSEPGAGWPRAAALDHDVWVLTRKNNAPAIDQALAKEPQLRLHPVYIDLPAWARFWKRGGRGVHLYYLLWQALAWRVARRLHRDVRFDAAHHYSAPALCTRLGLIPQGLATFGSPALATCVGGFYNQGELLAVLKAGCPAVCALRREAESLRTGSRLAMRTSTVQRGNVAYSSLVGAE